MYVEIQKSEVLDMLRYKVELVRNGSEQRRTLLVGEDFVDISCRGDAERLASVYDGHRWLINKIELCTEEMWDNLLWRAIFKDDVDVSTDRTPTYTEEDFA